MSATLPSVMLLEVKHKWHHSESNYNLQCELWTVAERNFFVNEYVRNDGTEKWVLL